MPSTPRVTVPSWVDRLILLGLSVAVMAVALVVVSLQTFTGQWWWELLLFGVIGLAFASVHWLMDSVFEQGWMAATYAADYELLDEVDPLVRDNLLAQLVMKRPATRTYHVDLATMVTEIDDMDGHGLDQIAAAIRKYRPER